MVVVGVKRLLDANYVQVEIKHLLGWILEVLFLFAFVCDKLL